MDSSPRARLGPGSSVLRWFLEPAGEVDQAGRAFLHAQLLASPVAAIMGSFCALIVASVALLRGGSIYGLFVVSELALMVWRSVEWRRRAKRMIRESSYVPSVNASVLISFLWCAQQGALAFAIMSGDDLTLMVLSATLVMAMIGPICARNYAAPRFAFTLVLMCDLPFVAGALASGEPWLRVIVPITPPFLFGVMQIITTFHRSMLLTLAVQAKAFRLARYDTLTGVLNRYGMDHALAQIPTNNNRQMALISIDLDGFKQVNDKHGHGAGDMLLAQVAKRVGEQLRTDDLLARMGGDELMVVVRNMAPDRVGRLADRLIVAISRHAYELGEGTVARVSASIGFACLPEDAANTVDLRLRADRALYAAKRAGKGIGQRYGTLAAASAPLSPVRTIGQ